MRIQMLFLALSVALASAPGWADDLASLSKDPKQWVMPAHDFASTRFSPLDQINASNVDKLQVAWMFSVGTRAARRPRRLSSATRFTSSAPFPTRCSRWTPQLAN